MCHVQVTEVKSFVVAFISMLLGGPVCVEDLGFCETSPFLILLETSGVESLEIGQGLGVFESFEYFFAGDLIELLSDGGINRTSSLSKRIGDLEVALDVLTKELDKESDDTTNDDEGDDEEDKHDECDSFLSPHVPTATLLLSREMGSLSL